MTTSTTTKPRAARSTKATSAAKPRASRAAKSTPAAVSPAAVDEVSPQLPPPSVATQLLDVPIKAIAQHPRNPRRAVGDVTDLAESIRAHGILEPLVVAPGTSEGTFLLIAGHRRRAAAVAAGLATVPALVRVGLDTEARQIEAMLVENLHRSDLTPVEEATAYQGLLDLGLTQSAVAAGTGQPVSRVRDRLKLNKVPAKAQQKLHEGQITIADAMALVEFADNRTATKTLTSTLGTDQFRHELARAREDRAADVALERRITLLREGGIAIAKTRPDEKFRIDRDPYYPGVPLVALANVQVHDSSKVNAWILKHHATCPGHVSTLTPPSYRGRQEVAHYCTKPELHPEAKKTGPQRSPEELARAKKENEQRKRIRDDAAVASRLRHEHMREHLTLALASGPTSPRLVALIMDKLTRAMGYRSVERQHQLLALSRVLGVDLPEMPGRAKVELGNIKADVEKALRSRSVQALVFVLDFVTNLLAEATLNDDDPKGYGLSRGAEWLVILRDHYGYTPSAWEVKRFKVPPVQGTVAAEEMAAFDVSRCTGCGEVVEDLGVVEGHPTECSLCAVADFDDEGDEQ